MSEVGKAIGTGLKVLLGVGEIREMTKNEKRVRNS